MKEEFLYNLSKTIKENPSWAADALLAVNYGVSEFGKQAQEKYNTAELILNFVKQNKQIKKMLDKNNIKL